MILFEFAVKASILLVVALLATLVARRRSAALRHDILSRGVAAALVLPALFLVAPGWDFPAASFATQGFRAEPVARPEAFQRKERGAPPIDRVMAQVPPVRLMVQALGVVWVAGSGALLIILGVGLFQLRRIEREAAASDAPGLQRLTSDLAAALQLHRPVRLLLSSRHSLPMTWGSLQHRILLPVAAKDWPEERTRVVLLHELAHATRHDWRTHMGASAMRALLWINPLAWIACRRLRHEAERAADDVVLAAGISGADYASHLLELARGIGRTSDRFLPAPAIVESTNLERRVRAMLSPSMNRAPLGAAARRTLAIAASIIAVSVAGGSAAQNLASFVGSVVDPQNAVLPGVEFTLTHAPSGTVRKVSSDRSGRVELNDLPAGIYDVEVSLPGFSTLRSRVSVQEGQRLEPMMMLQVGEIEETVTVVDDGAPGRRVYATTRPAPPACPGGPTSPTGQPIGGNIKPPRKIQSIAPDYPVSLAGSGVSGDVRLLAEIGTDGRVQNASVVSSARPEFGDAALEAVKLWEFTPTLLNCQAIPVRMHMFARFAGRS